jgi:hypothetical protein
VVQNISFYHRYLLLKDGGDTYPHIGLLLIIQMYLVILLLYIHCVCVWGGGGELGWLRGIAPGNRLDDLGFESQQGLGIFIFTIVSRPALGTTQPPIQWVPEALSLGIKQLGYEADHSPSSSVAFRAWCSIKAQGQHMFILEVIISHTLYSLLSWYV